MLHPLKACPLIVVIVDGRSRSIYIFLIIAAVLGEITMDRDRFKESKEKYAEDIRLLGVCIL